MSKSQILDKEDDYTISEEVIFSTPDLPSRLGLTILSFSSILLTTGVLLIINGLNSDDLITRIIPSLVVAVIIFVAANIGGRIWRKVGINVASMTYRVYTTTQTGWRKILARIYLIFLESDQQIFLEARARDRRYRGIKYRFSLITRVSITQLSFFIVASSFLVRPGMEYLRSLIPNFGIINQVDLILETQLLLTLFLSVILTGLYLPANFILFDANIRTWDHENRKIGRPLESMQSRVDSLVGIGAILAGWEYYKGVRVGSRLILIDLLGVKGGDLFWEVVDYVALLMYILVLSWPLIVPAVVTYFKEHGNLVNKFRENAMREGVQVAVTKIRLPNHEEEVIVSKHSNSKTS